jgi:integrase
MTSFRTFVLNRYSSIDAHRKVLGFAAAFLKYLAKVRVDPRYLSFTLFLERPKTITAKKALTERIVTREDIKTVFQRIAAKEEKGADPSKVRNYRAFALLAAYTGLRPSTIQRLTVGQFRTALNEKKPVLHVLAEQDKNRDEQY